MQEQKQTRLEAFREKYAALLVTLACLYTVIETWGEGWFFTILLSFGVLICGTFAFFSFKSRIKSKYTKN